MFVTVEFINNEWEQIDDFEYLLYKDAMGEHRIDADRIKNFVINSKRDYTVVGKTTTILIPAGKLKFIKVDQ